MSLMIGKRLSNVSVVFVEIKEMYSMLLVSLTSIVKIEERLKFTFK